MKRDKVISLRVDSRLYHRFSSIVDSKTENHIGRGGRNWYMYINDKGLSYYKFTAADLFEQALKAYIEKYESQP